MIDTQSDSPGLVVPVDVEALCLRPSYLNEHSPSLLSPLVQFEDLKVAVEEREQPFVSRSALTTAFSDASTETPSDAGIYVHWALPDALTQGASSGQHGAPDFPAVPDRWLVVRTVLKDGGDGPSADRAAWVLDGNYVATVPSAERRRQGAVCVPQPINPTVWLGAGNENSFLPQMYGYIGRVVPLDKWADRGKPSGASYQEQPYPDTLTALGYGEPAWAALSPASGPCFSFFDRAEAIPAFDASSDALQYTVVGWYSDGDDDPTQHASAEQVLTAHDWGLADAAPPDSFGYSLYHGTVGAIPWGTAEGDPQIPSTDDLSVSVGNNAPEAVSALVASEAGDGDAGSDGALEYWMNALQLGLLDDVRIDDITDPERIRAQIHAGAFSATATGQRWTVTADGDGTAAPHEQDPYAEALASLSDHQTQLLHDLNTAQRRLNRLRADLRSRRFQLFSDWWRAMVANVDGRQTYHRGTDGCRDGQMLCRLYKQLMVEGEGTTAKYDDMLKSDRVQDLQPHVVQAPSSPLHECQQTIQNTRSALESTLDGTSLSLTTTSADPFERPTDPVVLLKGPVADPPERHGQDGRHSDDGRLSCRLSTGLVSEVQYDGSASIDISRSPLPGLTTTPPGPAASVAEALAREALLLDPSSAVFWAGHAPAAEQTAFQTALKTVVEGGTPPSALTVTGVWPSPTATKQWTAPWNPIALEWEVDLSPMTPIQGAHDTYEASVIETNYSVGHAGLNYEQGTPVDRQETYQGRVVLSTGAQTSLKERIERSPHFEGQTHWTKKKLRKLLDTLDNAPILSQSLGGFHEWMLQKHETFQIEALDPDHPRLTEDLGRAVGTRPPKSGATPIAPVNTHAPDPVTWFNPIRAGVAELKRLRVIDTFGQLCEIDLTTSTAPPVHVAEALQVPSDMDTPAADGPQVYLPPRLCQASRLNLEWVSAQGQRESGSDPASSPICGWVVPVYLTDGLKVFSQEGTPLGTLYTVEDGGTATVAWEDAPLAGDADTVVGAKKAAQKAQSVLQAAHANDALTQFVVQTLSNGGGYLQHLLKTIEAVHATVDPGAHQEAPIKSLIMGQPLALTRARVSMELHGRRALNQSYEALLDHLQKSYQDDGGSAQPYDDRTSNGFDQVRFPVKLGSLQTHYDGLIGYFADGDYGTFHTLASTADADPHIKPSTGPEALSVTPTSATTEAAEAADTDDPSRHPREVAFLMDPRTKVHATTGVQPVKAVDIPARHYQPVLRDLQVSVLTTPVLSGPPPAAAQAHEQGDGNFGLPLPSTKEGTWSWVEQQAPSGGGAVDWTQTSEEDIHSVSDKDHRSYPHLTAREGWLLYDRNPGDTSATGAG